MPLSGRHEPTAEMKKSTAAMTSERLRPKREASRPEIAPPMTQPISALEAVKPCIHDV